MAMFDRTTNEFRSICDALARINVCYSTIYIIAIRHYTLIPAILYIFFAHTVALVVFEMLLIVPTNVA